MSRVVRNRSKSLTWRSIIIYNGEASNVVIILNNFQQIRWLILANIKQLIQKEGWA